MCTREHHVFIFHAATTATTLPVGFRCVCGAERWGTDAELRALDEINGLEGMLALPWPPRTAGA